MTHRVVATAGHVDHGKSALVLALTGTDPDRWPEEKARGLTIDLGFAATSLPSGREVAFVDVPGHVRFLKNMLAGVGAVDACLFVVAATEGWKPQSEEHLSILSVLGMRTGLVALTKVGLVDDDLRELARMELDEHLTGTFLHDAEVVEVDAPTGRGVDAVRAALDRLLDRTPTAHDAGRPRLWVDRSFSARGAGTVVTGTLAGGALSVDDELAVVGDDRPPSRRRRAENGEPVRAPAGHAVRVRGLQSLGRTLRQVGPGHRVAVNLAGIDHRRVARGHALVRAEQWHGATVVDASLQVLAALDHPMSRRGAYLAYIGSGEHPVRLRVLGPAAVAPGTTGLVRLHLPVALPLSPGDRYVLRESGRDETVGGGEVLDVAPVLKASAAQPDRSVDRVIAERRWVRAGDLEVLTGVQRQPDLGPWVVAPEARHHAAERIAALVVDAGPLGLAPASLSEPDRLVLASLVGHGVEMVDGRARPSEAADPLADHPYLAALRATPFMPPPPDGVDRAELRASVQRGLVVERDGVWFAASAVQQAIDVVARQRDEHPEGFTVSQAREALGTTRKWAVPLLSLLDASGATRRRGDVRIAGPRLRA